MEAVLILLLVAGAWFWEANPTDTIPPEPTSNTVEASTTSDVAVPSSQAVGCWLADQPARYRDLTQPWQGDPADGESRASARLR